MPKTLDEMLEVCFKNERIEIARSRAHKAYEEYQEALEDACGLSRELAIAEGWSEDESELDRLIESIIDTIEA